MGKKLFRSLDSMIQKREEEISSKTQNQQTCAEARLRTEKILILVNGTAPDRNFEPGGKSERNLRPACPLAR